MTPARLEDVRDVAATEPAPVGEDEVRVRPAEEMAEWVRRSQRALFEIRAREAVDAERELHETRVDPHTSEDDQVDHDGVEVEDASW